MRGGSYRLAGDRRERLDRETGKWVPCDEQGYPLAETQADEGDLQPDIEEEIE